MRLHLLTGKQILNKLNKQSIRHLKSIYSRSSNTRFLSTSKCLNYAHDPMPPVDPRKYGGDGQNYLDPDIRLKPPPPKSVEDFADPEKTGHWVSYGFDEVDKKADRYWYRVGFFFAFSLIMPFMGFYMYYEPDTRRMHEWATREAFLELHRREKYGLPLIDPDYVPRDRIPLPAEEDIKIEVHY